MEELHIVDTSVSDEYCGVNTHAPAVHTLGRENLVAWTAQVARWLGKLCSGAQAWITHPDLGKRQLAKIVRCEQGFSLYLNTFIRLHWFQEPEETDFYPHSRVKQKKPWKETLDGSTPDVNKLNHRVWSGTFRTWSSLSLPRSRSRNPKWCDLLKQFSMALAIMFTSIIFPMACCLTWLIWCSQFVNQTETKGFVQLK